MLHEAVQLPYHRCNTLSSVCHQRRPVSLKVKERSGCADPAGGKPLGSQQGCNLPESSLFEVLKGDGS